MDTLWTKCLDQLQGELPAQQFNTWLRPLQADFTKERVILLAPNQFVLDHVNQHFIKRISTAMQQCTDTPIQVNIAIGTKAAPAVQSATTLQPQKSRNIKPSAKFDSHLNPAFVFDHFVVGSSNEIARAAAMQVADNPGTTYNPLFIYGGVGLGKTHLMHSIGNKILENKPDAKVLYLHSEKFVSDMVRSLQHNQMEAFKKVYRSVDVLLIDDIQFFAGKDRSQEEFFNTFNVLLDGQQQIILTCDRYYKEMSGVEERLKSRFGWGLTVAIEPPEFETRVAIIKNKAEQSQVEMEDEVAFFIAKRIQSNVRELEGALKRVIANAHFTGHAITIDFVKEVLKDLLAVQAKLVSIQNIQKTVAEYYKIKLTDLLSKRRSRFVARARQMAMTLAKELTNHSLPEIGDAFGGRDHTTVLHARRKIKELCTSDTEIQKDYTNLLRILST